MKNIDKKFNALMFFAFIAMLTIGGKIQIKIEDFLYNIAGDSPILQLLAWIITYVGGMAIAFFLSYQLFCICNEWESRRKDKEEELWNRLKELCLLL